MTRASTPPLRLAFAGTPEFAAAILAALIEHYRIVAVYSQPARPAGRGRKPAISPVEALARERSIPVRTPASLKGESAALEALDLDVLVVAAYGKLLGKEILDTPRYGCVNVHASLLPRWRGAAPIERAMLAGDEVTGVSIMQMDEGLDTGPIIRQVACPIFPEDVGDDVHDRLAMLGARTLLDCLSQLQISTPTAQSIDGVTYAPKLTPEDSKINWTRPAKLIAAQIRALNSRQPATSWVDGERIRLLFAQAIERQSAARPGTIDATDRSHIEVACGVGTIRITRVALSRGRGKPMDIAALRNGYPGLLRLGQVMDAGQ